MNDGTGRKTRGQQKALLNCQEKLKVYERVKQ